jgi:hypothetical protein
MIEFDIGRQSSAHRAACGELFEQRDGRGSRRFRCRDLPAAALTSSARLRDQQSCTFRRELPPESATPLIREPSGLA